MIASGYEREQSKASSTLLLRDSLRNWKSAKKLADPKDFTIIRAAERWPRLGLHASLRLRVTRGAEKIFKFFETSFHFFRRTILNTRSGSGAEALSRGLSSPFSDLKLQAIPWVKES